MASEKAKYAHKANCYYACKLTRGKGVQHTAKYVCVLRKCFKNNRRTFGVIYNKTGRDHYDTQGIYDH